MQRVGGTGWIVDRNRVLRSEKSRTRVPGTGVPAEEVGSGEHETGWGMVPVFAHAGEQEEPIDGVLQSPEDAGLPIYVRIRDAR